MVCTADYELLSTKQSLEVWSRKGKHFSRFQTSMFIIKCTTLLPPRDRAIPFMFGSIFFDPAGMGDTLATLDDTDLFGVRGEPPGTLGEAS